MILLSPGGTAVQRQEGPSARLVVGTVEGIFVFKRDAERRWVQAGRALEGCFVSALTRLESGALIAGTHGLGVARSDDGGLTWRLGNAGLSHFDVWVVKADRLAGRERLFAGTLPAHLFVSDDGAASWRSGERLPGIDYPIPLVAHPDDPDLLFVAGGEGWPPNWYQIGRSRAKLARSRDGGRSWQRLLGGLPDGQRPTFGGLALEAWDGGFAVRAADTDGQIYESRDGGDRWSVVAEAAPVSKGEQYRGLAKGRPPLVGTDSLLFAEAGQRRVSQA